MIGTVNDNKKHVNGLKTNANLGKKTNYVSKILSSSCRVNRHRVRIRRLPHIENGNNKVIKVSTALKIL